MNLEDVIPTIKSHFPHHFDVNTSSLEDSIGLLLYEYGKWVICYFLKGQIKISRDDNHLDDNHLENITFDKVKNHPHIKWIILENSDDYTLFFREEHIALEVKMKYF